MSTSGIKFKPGTRTIQDLQNLYDKDQLNLAPGFQRQSVWQDRDRAKLIESILRNFPLPTIFLYRRQHNGQIVYDVIDGKQRIESIFRFMGVMKKRFVVKMQFPDDGPIEIVDWAFLKKRMMQPRITGYEIPVVEVDGEISDIIDLFVRINSTGKALTPQERRNAKYSNSPFMKEVNKLARKYEKYFIEMKVLSKSQIARMKHVEFICELMISIHRGEPINKKAALDKIMDSSGFDLRSLRKTFQRTTRAMNRVKSMFPRLATTRFSQITDFYSLVLLVSKFEDDRLILTDKNRNQLAFDMLTVFSNEIDDLRMKQRKAQNIASEKEGYRQYLLTVLQATDEINHRRQREAILRELLETLYQRQDKQRGFSVEQRRILWNTSAVRKCQSCKKQLTWSDFTIDHISPYSKGGRSKLDNAALLCRPCNSKKGNK